MYKKKSWIFEIRKLRYYLLPEQTSSSWNRLMLRALLIRKITMIYLSEQIFQIPMCIKKSWIFEIRKLRYYHPPGADVVVLKPTDVEGAVDKDDYDDLLPNGPSYLKSTPPLWNILEFQQKLFSHSRSKQLSENWCFRSRQNK